MNVYTPTYTVPALVHVQNCQHSTTVPRHPCILTQAATRSCSRRVCGLSLCGRADGELAQPATPQQHAEAASGPPQALWHYSYRWTERVGCDRETCWHRDHTQPGTYQHGRESRQQMNLHKCVFVNTFKKEDGLQSACKSSVHASEGTRGSFACLEGKTCAVAACGIPRWCAMLWVWFV